jgi:succinate dehydrogenase/fumarate reductase cytochrome b subunit
MKTTITLNQIFQTFSRLQRSCGSAVFLMLFLLSASSSWGQIAQRGTATTGTSTSAFDKLCFIEEKRYYNE